MASQDEGQRSRQLPPSPIHDVITGGIEGGVGIFATEPVLAKLSGEEAPNIFRGGVKGISRRFGAGAAVGAGATGLIGALVSMAGKKTRKPKDSQLSALQDFVVELKRGRYDLVDDEEKGQPDVLRLPGSSRAHAALKGGLIGTGVGAAIGVAAGEGLMLAGNKFGAKKVVSRITEALGKHPRIKAGLYAGGTVGKIGATVGAIQGVANYNEDEARSKAIARALRKARAEGRQERLSARQRVVEFAYDLNDTPRLRAGYRLDKYRKTIQASEIDRKISNTAKAAVVGSLVGALIPHAGTSIGKRALIGAGGGAGLAGALQIGSRNDPYGEESELAKLTQTRAVQGAALAGTAYGLHRRRQAIKAAITKLKGFRK